LSRLRRPAKPLVVLVAFALLALVFSACAYFKPGSFSLSQPGAVGAARVHFVLCTEPEPNCGPSETEGTLQYLLGIAVPPGSTPPATVTATPLNGAPPIVFTLNEEVSRAIAASSSGNQKFLEEEGAPPEVLQMVGGTWPPSGLQGVGYLSAPIQETKGSTLEWSVDADFGLPVAADGSPFAGPFATGVALGFRPVTSELPANRPVRCAQIESESVEEGSAVCGGSAQQGQIGTSDLKIGAPAQASAFLGGKAKLAFPFNFATTAVPSPSFALSATSTLPKAKFSLASPTFVPGTPDPTTHRSPTANQTVTVTVPKKAKPGTYEVTLTASTPQGGLVSQVAKLKVTKQKLSLGGVKLNKSKGTATLSVKIPGAGILTATGKGIAKAKKSAKQAKKPKTLKLTIKAKGKAKKQLAEEGTAKVSAKVTFKPTSGTPVTKTKRITLKQN
jgi:hypothetical protein